MPATALLKSVVRKDSQVVLLMYELYPVALVCLVTGRLVELPDPPHINFPTALHAAKRVAADEVIERHIPHLRYRIASEYAFEAFIINAYLFRTIPVCMSSVRADTAHCVLCMWGEKFQADPHNIDTDERFVCVERFAAHHLHHIASDLGIDPDVLSAELGGDSSGLRPYKVVVQHIETRTVTVTVPALTAAAARSLALNKVTDSSTEDYDPDTALKIISTTPEHP